MPDTIEAEVLEIDGSAPPPPHEPEPPRRDDPWRAMRGRVVKLDRRWWPLWLLLGMIALALALTVGVVVAAVLFVVRLIAGVFGWLAGAGSSPTSGTSLSK